MPERRFQIDGHSFPAGALEPGLYCVATPIGNLKDITLRALEVLAAADRIACEDKRTSLTLLQRYGIEAPLTAYHDHNGAQARPALLDTLAKGEAVALISDAGTPLIADPGYKLIVEARDAGHPVFAIAGPSALTAALSIAGQPTDRFAFGGFLPPKAQARAKAIADWAGFGGTVCFYEAPHRLAETLSALADGLGDERPASVAREITKRFETVVTGTLGSLAEHYGSETAKGEIVIIVGPAVEEDADPASVEAALRVALSSAKVKDAAREVADQFDLPRRDVYQLALSLREDDGKADG